MSKLKINGELDINSYLTAISDLYLSSADGASIIFRNGTTEAGRITSDGYLQLGGTSTGAYRLYVNGNSYFTGTNYLYGTTYGRYLYPSTNGSYSLGSSSYVWGSAYIRNLYIYDSTNNRSVGGFYVATQGTTSASGISCLTIGNSYSSGTAGNAYGVLRIYSTSSTYGDLRSSGGSVTHYLPSIGGTLLNTGNYNSYVPKLDGTGATGTWSINISGNAATATNASKLGGYNATEFFRRGENIAASCNDVTTSRSYWSTNTATEAPTAWGALLDFNTGCHHQLFLSFTGDESYVGLYTRAKVNEVWQPWSRYLNTDNYSSFALPLSGGTITGSVNFSTSNQYYDLSTHTGGAIRLNNGDIGGVNSIYFKDAAGKGEGLHFYVSSTTVDTLRATGGVLYFDKTYDIAAGTAAATYTIVHSGNYTSYQVDSKVTQSLSNASNWRPILLHYINTTQGTDPGTATNQVYYNAKAAVNPSTGGIYSAGTVTCNRIIATSTTDAAYNAANSVGLIIGSASGTHIEMDNNEIFAKTSGTAAGTLYLQSESGNTEISSGGVTTIGSLATFTNDEGGGFTFAGRIDVGCLLLTNTGWTGYGTVDPEDAGLTKVKGRIYFKISS